MTTRGELLRQVMLETGTTQTLLSRVTGVHQPSISQFLSGKVELSDDMLVRLLSGMGYELEVVRRPVRPVLTHSERRSWMLHQRLSTHLTQDSLDTWLPVIDRNLKRLGERLTGRTHVTNLERWRHLVTSRDVQGMRRVLTGLDRGSIEMREVSPLGGLLPQDERLDVMNELSRAS